MLKRAPRTVAVPIVKQPTLRNHVSLFSCEAGVTKNNRRYFYMA